MSFDRAADFYDATRALPPDVHARLTAILAAELTPRGRCLEIGVGTGRIALPLVAEGVDLVGLDIAPLMLRRLVDNAGGRRPLPLCVADVTALPFADRRFDAVVASHVLHLVVDWRATVDEAVRVVGPGGVLLVDFGGGPSAPWGEPADAVMRSHVVVRVRPGVSSPEPVADHLSGRAVARPLPPLTMTVERTLGQDLADWEGQRHSWTWSANPAQIAAGCDGVRRWAADDGWPLDRRVELERTIQWWAFDLVDPA
ncbi:MAG TPA: class I SAM-dependent methyltransferase [Acidimicrobiales bacterium]|nr:class I SAM-dependent methyltransferase [Acidimicrobiales bacterium]